MEDEEPTRVATRLLWLGLALSLAAGIYLRISVYGQSVVGDELSTLWIVDNHSLGGTIDFVSGDGEISPPLFFAAAWLASKLGSAAELIRLPSLLAGAGSLVIYYVIGTRLFGRTAAIIATCVASFSPILVYFSANGRSYSLMLFLLLASLLCLLLAADDGRKRWWVGYALASCLAMYTHYTAAFVLIAQLAWLFWANPEARKPALISNVGAAALFLPWLPGYFADSDSPTIPILEALQGHGFEAKRIAVEQLLFWRIGSGEWSMAGRWDAVLISVALFAALVVFAVRMKRRSAFSWRPSPELVLLVLIAVATPVGALILGVFSTDVFGGRNLAGSWVALPLLAGALLAACGAVWGTVCTLAVIAGLAYTSVELTDRGNTEIPYKDTAAYIESIAGPGDVVVNRAHLTPVPLTPLDAYLDPDLPGYRIGLPVSDPPFLPGSIEIPDPAEQLDQALDGHERAIFVTVGDQAAPFPGQTFEADGIQATIPRNWKVGSIHIEDGIYPVTVTVLERSQPEGRGKEQ
ncbi:MAG: glycosyltransferase family 39 protein [Actinomycetota bacterium]|nr:glycosyltransferase family 39 protein [Actinomycetota bacterium]